MTIISKNGRYGVKVYDRGKQKWIGTFDTRKAARRAEREAMDSLGDADVTCGSLAERWPREVAPLRGWRESTRRQYVQMLKPFIASFGDVDLAEIDRQAAKRFARSHPASVRFVQAMFADAVKDGLVSTNPFLGLRPPRGRGRRDIEALTEQELRALADKALELHFDYGPTVRAMILFAGYTGVREGEMFARMGRSPGRRGDDRSRSLEHGTSRASEDRLRAPHHRAAAGSPGASRDAAHRPLASHLPLPHRQAPEEGVPLPRMGQGADAYGRPGLAWHELRHAAATILLERGVDRDAVAIQLGHRGTRLVDDTYGHPSETAARERLRRAFAEPTPLRPVAREVAEGAG